MNKTIGIVTGATGGIGREFTRILASEELDEIWIVARNKDKLEDLKNEYGDRIRTIALDLSKTDNLNKIKELLENEKPIIKYLINNASIAKMGLYKEFSIEEMENTINLNCKTPVILSNICIPFMKKGSSILNIASASAFQPTPYINLYAATKAFERSYSRALNVELAESGIIVTAVCPSWVDTELLTKTINGHEVKFPGIVTARRVAQKAIKDAKRGKDMSVCTFYVKVQHLYVKLLPQSFIMKIWMKGIKKYI